VLGLVFTPEIFACKEFRPPGSYLGGLLLLWCLPPRIFTIQVRTCTGIYFSGLLFHGSSPSRSAFLQAVTFLVPGYIDFHPSALCLPGPDSPGPLYCRARFPLIPIFVVHQSPWGIPIGDLFTLGLPLHGHSTPPVPFHMALGNLVHSLFGS